MAHRVDRKATDFIASLFEVPREIGHASLPSFLALIVNRSAEWFGASSVSLFLRRGDSDSFDLAATGGPRVSVPDEAVIDAGHGIAGIAIQDGEPVLISDPAKHPKFRALAGRSKTSLSSSMVVPLASGGGSIGVLNLSRAAGKARFSAGDLRLAKSVANHLALAIENARLIASLQEVIQATEAEKAKFSSIFEGLGVAAFLLNVDGQVIEANSTAMNLDTRLMDLGLFPRSVDSKQEIELVDPKSGRSWLAVLNPIPDGATLILEETTTRDRQRNELDRLNRLAEIGQMTAAIAHEIRNPLTGIRSAAQLIRQEPDSAGEFAEIIEQEAMKLNELCSQFLGFAKPLDLSFQETNVQSVVERAVVLLTPEFNEKGVQLCVQIGRDLPMIMGDPLHWEQVLLNLMLNALEASKAGSVVLVGASRDCFWVEDRGCGISPDHVPRLFTPFFTTKPQGTGLGLSNVKKIVDAHGATISVRSELEGGTRFDISFPSRKAA